MTSHSIIRAALLCVAATSLLPLGGCRRDMYNQPKAKPLSASNFFKDGSSSRPLPPHTVAVDNDHEDGVFYTGLMPDGTLTAKLPVPFTQVLLARGRERFDIYCAVCHGLSGDGNGRVVQRGFPAPPSYHIDRLRNAPIGHFYDVMTNGYGVMYPYASRVEPADRWAIAAYIRALQLSRHTSVGDLTPTEQQKLETQP